MADFQYYEHEGAYFRRPADAPGRGVREVLHGNQWVPYEGDDLMEPVVYGNRVEEGDIEMGDAPAGGEPAAAPAAEPEAQ
ncbi:MAG: hypothetical protein AB9M53_01170 [Leptothrix sp. (in: b-proteobacteria)]